MKELVLVCAAALCLVGCKKKDAPPEGAKPTETAAASAAPQAAAEPAEAPSPSGGKKAWELHIAGKGDFSGPVVMLSKPSRVAMYGLIGGDAMTYVHVEDGKTDAYAVQVGFSGQMCMYRSDNKQMSKGIAVTLSGDKYEVDGEITCGPVAGGQKSVHAIKGSFEKK